MNDTIFALSTASGRAAVAVVRLSGPGSAAALMALSGSLPRARMASVRSLIDPVSRETLDEAIVLFMPGPASFTGEDVVELHLHGGRAVTNAILELLGSLGARPAGPGEFTRRAFEHGKLDLTEAEAIADLIDAESAAQRRQALAQLGGSSARYVAGWRAALVQTLAMLEASIDFPDEDVPAAVAERAIAPMRKLLAEISAAANDFRGERIREGYRIALIGAPNAGKSSVLNALLGRDVVIVTDVPGTTRDVIERDVELAGYRVVLADMAGLRVTTDIIEAEGVRRALEWALAAELRVLVIDASVSDGACRAGLHVARQGDIVVLNKADLPSGEDENVISGAVDALELEPISTSTVCGEGIVEFKEALRRRVIKDLGGADIPAASRLRHRRLLEQASRHLARALEGGDPELVVEDVRLASRELEALSGRIEAEAVLGEVFSTFCIGK